MPAFSNMTPAGSNSFGISDQTMGPGFRVNEIFSSERYRELLFRESFFKSTHHDHKLWDMSGRMTRPGPPSNQPYFGNSMPAVYVPLDARRPNAPYRLPRVIVKGFTSLLFGYDRWPSIKVVGDPQTQDFAEALVKAQKLPAKMQRARDIGGSVGTVGISWCFFEGKPRVRVHKGYNLHVHEWVDRDELIPAHVSEIKKVPDDEWDPERKQFVRRYYWERRDWSTTADIVFKRELVTGENPSWTVDEEKSNGAKHDDGFAHFVWVQNLPNDEDIDGEPDYADLYENFGTIDTLNSVVAKGGMMNLDPTVVLGIEPERMRHVRMLKGSDNALAVGKGGSAQYMEVSGNSITAGNSLIERERNQALEVAQCVVPDPNTVAAAGTSSVAIKMIYHPMLGKADLLRDQYGTAIERLLSQQIQSARKALGIQTEEVLYEVQGDEADDEQEAPSDEQNGAPVDQEPASDEQEPAVEHYLALPPRIEEKPVLDDNGQPTGEVTITKTERAPGEGGDLELEWGEYYKKTDDDRQKSATTMSTAAGGKPVLSHKSAVEKTATEFGLDPEEEWQEVARQMRESADQQQGMFPGIGGAEQPPEKTASETAKASEDKGTKPADDKAAKNVDVQKQVLINRSDIASVMTVNEVRGTVGLPPLPDPDGSMTVAEFQASREAKGQVTGESEGKQEAKDEGLPPPTDTGAGHPFGAV